MWIANGWKEYEVIDTSCGEKLERWGKYLLVRPDPQVIWDTPKTEPGWRKMKAHYPVSYTHLDVYKRQASDRVTENPSAS